METVEKQSIMELSKKHTTIWTIAGIWFVFRIFTSISAAAASAIRPLSDVEQAIPIWPPSLPVGPWLYRIFISPWSRWDTNLYTTIIQNGYQPDAPTLQFHPLYPWISAVFARLTLDPVASLLLVSSVSGFLFLLVYHQLAKHVIRNENYNLLTPIVIFLAFPSAYIIFAPYSESLFLLLSALTLLFSIKRNWWLAGTFGALAAITRQQGLFLIVPILIEFWEWKGRDFRKAVSDWRGWLSALLVPIAYGVWLLYRGLLMNDFHPDFSSLHSFIYSVIISPEASQVVHQQAFLLPWQALGFAINKALLRPDADIITNLIVVAVFMVITAIAWPNLKLSYKVYSLLIILVSLSYWTGPEHPYMGLPRHLLLAFPLFIDLVTRMNTVKGRLFYAAVGTVGVMVMVFQHALESWVP